MATGSLRVTAVGRLVQEAPHRFRIERHGVMRVPGVVYASRELVPAAADDKALEQVANVACLPGIVRASYAMPDVHWGYGFPIGGVAATDVDEGGVVSPGGVGFDISCGVRLLVARDLRRADLAPVLRSVMDRLDRLIPRGAGPGALWSMRDDAQLRRVLLGGARYAVEQGHGVPRDLERCEDHGVMEGVDLTAVSHRALHRGIDEVGSLGSGNHFLEVQAVDDVSDEAAAAAMGLTGDAVCVMIHCGSRGLGHQICTDHVQVMDQAIASYDISVPDRQLACAPVRSPEGQAYLGAMAAAANYGRANRQLLAEAVRRVFEQEVSTTLDLVYDVSHNLARLEVHDVDGRKRTLCVHRKGATRSAPPHHPELPADLAEAGQPVMLPGTMGTASYVMAGVAGNPAFDSTAHGAGRVMSRHRAAKNTSGRLLKTELEARGILVRGASWRGLAEEKPEAYKDIEAVVTVSHEADLARRVARLVPLGVVKG
jgi:tRNA-splicing ligase RtcB